MCTNVCWLLKGVETGDSRIYVCGICLFFYHTYKKNIFEKFLLDDIYIIDFVNKTSHDKGGICAIGYLRYNPRLKLQYCRIFYLISG